jgi:hypothetical protein
MVDFTLLGFSATAGEEIVATSIHNALASVAGRLTID